MEKQRVTLFLTFNGTAEEAMNYYATTFSGAKITKLVRYGKTHPFADEDGENKVLQGVLSLMGQEIMFLDMDTDHPAPDLNWSASIYLDCRDEAEFDEIFNCLSQGGMVMMGPESVGRLRKCAWVTDKFGVTWQPVWE